MTETVADLECRLPLGWKIGSIMTNDREFHVTLYHPASRPSARSIKDGRGGTLEAAFITAANQITSGRA